MGDVAELAESIKEIGLINSITLNEDLELIAGLHRLEACKSLGWSEIPATVLSLNEIDLQIATIDENLIRNELSVLERAEELARKKEFYEAKYPQTKHGKKNKDAIIASLPKSFVKDTAVKTGKSSRSISQDVQIAKSIPPEVKESIRGKPLENKKVELLTLSRFDKATQKEVVQIINENESETVETALIKVAQKPAPNGFKSKAQVALEHKKSAGYKWNNSLYKTLIQLNSIRDAGGIEKLIENWSVEHRKQYAENCREYAETYTEFAEAIEETL